MNTILTGWRGHLLEGDTAESQNALTVFRFGHCHSLALAITQIVKGQLVGCFDKNDYDDIPGHVAVKIGDNILDIKGLRPIKVFREDYRKVAVLSKKKVEKMPLYLTAEPQKALPIAKELIKKHIDKF